MGDWLDRFFDKIQVDTNACWNWTSNKHNLGYGLFKLNNVNWYAYRVSYFLFNGILPKNLELDHLCRNRLCINPDHLEAVTHQENCKRGNIGLFWKSKTHCPQGHEYNEENTYKNPFTNRRYCRICKEESKKRLKRERQLVELKVN